MSEAILMVDMPESCDGCEMCDRIPGPWCRATGNVIAGNPESGRATGCPLRPMPDEVKPKGYDDAWDTGYTVGWNELRYRILGGLNE